MGTLNYEDWSYKYKLKTIKCIRTSGFILFNYFKARYTFLVDMDSRLGKSFRLEIVEDELGL